MSRQGNYQQSRGSSSNRGNYGSQFSCGNYGGPSNRGALRQSEPQDPELTKPIQTINAIDQEKRDWFGINGREVDLISNYFTMDVRSNQFFRYFVDIQYMSRKENLSDEEKKKDRPVKNRLLLRRVLWEFLRKIAQKDDKWKFVYDDKSILLSPVDILGEVEERSAEFECEDPNTNENFKFCVTIRTKSVVWLDMQLLNLILTQFSRHPFGPLIREKGVFCETDCRFIMSSFGFEPLKINEFLRQFRGLYSTIKKGPGGKMLANYDVRHSTFITPKISILEFYAFSKNVSLPNIDQLRDMGMNQAQRSELNSFLHGMLLSPRYGNFQNRNQRFLKVSNQTARNATFTDKQGTTMTVEAYFAQKHNIILKLPNLPLIQVGSANKNICIPMELLVLADKHQRLKMKLPDELQALTNNYTTTRPIVRFNIINKMMNECLVGDRDEVAKEFGVNVDLKMLKIKGRVLDPPLIQHRVKTEKPFGPKIEVKLAVINLNRAIREDVEVREKINNLSETCSKFGLKFTEILYEPLDTRNLKDLKVWLTSLKKKLGPESLALFIVGDRDKNFYDELKSIGDLEVGFRTQVVKTKTFLKIGNFTMNANLFRKMNNKVGGVNMTADRKQWSYVCSKDSPTLFIGADVTHAAPGDNCPSVAALVGNIDIDANEYGATVEIQPTRCEQVLGIGPMLLKRLEAFKKSIGAYPTRIVYFRDGVADSQFDMVINQELSLMKRSCEKLKISPKFTVLIVQKRHSTRFYAETGGDQNGNVLPATIVDRYITSQDSKQFFLCAHKGLLGTSKPINYWVLVDENNFSADGLQGCANILCNLFGRAAGPVSLPAPTYYAHLTCFRARSYINYISKGVLLSELKPEFFNAHKDLEPFMYFS